MCSLEVSCLVALLFRAMSTGTGLISTFELFLFDEGSLRGLLLGPQVISLEHLIIYGYFLPENYTFSLRRSSRFLTPELFAMRASSCSFFCLVA
jgi:hypothetical protein